MGATSSDPGRVAATDYDAVVLGAGISGLVSAAILVEQGNERVLVVDTYSHVGGNHMDQTHNGFTFDVGSFIFQDDSPLLKYFPELLPLYEPIDPTWGRLNPQGMITEYPFSIKDDFLLAGLIECTRMLWSVAVARLRRRPMRSARDFAEYWLGSRLTRRSGLEKYMERFCGLPAELIDLKFAEKRMLWIAEQASFVSVIRRLTTRRNRTSNQPTNRQLARPREGFEHLYSPAVQKLEQSGVAFFLNAELTSLEKSPTSFALQLGDRRATAPRLVSTIPVDRVLDLCGLPSEKTLPTVTLISLFFSFTGVRGFDQSILYNFSHAGDWKRLTVYSDFYGSSAGRQFFAVEVIAGRMSMTVELAAQNFRRHTADNGLLTGDLRLEGTHVLTQAYPIYTEGAGERAEASIRKLRDFGVESFGRQGGFQYQPTARVSTVEAEVALVEVSTPEQP